MQKRQFGGRSCFERFGFFSQLRCLALLGAAWLWLMNSAAFGWGAGAVIEGAPITIVSSNNATIGFFYNGTN